MLSARPEIDAPRYMSKANVIDINECWPLNGGLDSNKWEKSVVSIMVLFQHLAFIIAYRMFRMSALTIFKSNIWKEYLNCDVIIEGHDGTFGSTGALGIPYFYLLYLPLFAKMLNKPVVIYGGTIPSERGFYWPLTKTLYKYALNNISLITLRERISYQNAKSIGARKMNIFITSDPAFLLEPAPLERGIDIMNKEGIKKNSAPLVGVTVTRRRASMAYPQLGDTSASYYKHVELMAEMVDNLINNYGAIVIFIPHCIGFGDELDDRLVARDIIKICKYKQNVVQITNEYDANELKCLIGQFDMFIGERLHSVVNAMSMKIPSIVICNSTDQRLDIIRLFGQDNAICFAENLECKVLLSKINYIWSNREKIKEELTMQIQSATELSMHNGKLLKDILEPQNKSHNGELN